MTLWRAVVYRGLLGAMLAIGCHWLGWIWLQSLTTRALVILSQAAGLGAAVVNSTTLEAHGLRFENTVACTLVSYFFAAAPALWDTAVSIQKNAIRLTAFFAGLFVFNVLRLEIGVASYAGGIPWWLGHECVGGVAQFLIIFFIVRQCRWLSFPAQTGPEGYRGI